VKTIARNVWDEQFDPFSNVIDVYVNRLRKKIDHGFEHHLLHTRRGEGFMFAILPATSAAIAGASSNRSSLDVSFPSAISDQ